MTTQSAALSRAFPSAIGGTALASRPLREITASA